MYHYVLSGLSGWAPPSVLSSVSSNRVGNKPTTGDEFCHQCSQLACIVMLKSGANFGAQMSTGTLLFPTLISKAYIVSCPVKLQKNVHHLRFLNDVPFVQNSVENTVARLPWFSSGYVTDKLNSSNSS